MVLTAGSGLTYGAFAPTLRPSSMTETSFRNSAGARHSAFQNVRDVRYLRGVDMGFVQSNVLATIAHGLIPTFQTKSRICSKSAS